ncbi:MAG: nucleoside deaminase [Acidimicrobiia bacterium]
MGAAADAYRSLDEAWQLAIDEAWRSWSAGSAGVGAVITDGAQRIIAVGRNRIAEPRSEPGVLAWTTLAHAEMNALAVLDLGADARTITTTFEPCLMCAATILQTGIPQVRYASADPFFDGLGDWFATLDVPGKPAPASSELGGPIGAFAHVLHTSWLAFWASNAEVMDAHQRLRPAHLRVAREIVEDEHLRAMAAEGAGVVDALERLWPSLRELADGSGGGSSAPG